ncbi:hypothetical protein [Bifidobacterium tibiigranuli]|uniref:hypothetical protein n=1 Tax=Bifidobacterium tibiigranuli TaxID=2172043 RepID=UPI0023527581|nr:hypothetical protein [Bifidobacterium tibiigranuli]MCI1210993.1 hypothetical protein [Bifidobacterium tibiigranuli]MCI1220439.1 hypothetical protein [Bifidobacterium tibiigranuli]
MIDDEAEGLDQLRRDRLAEAERGLRKLVRDGMLTPETYGKIWMVLHAESAQLVEAERVRRMHGMRHVGSRDGVT